MQLIRRIEELRPAEGVVPVNGTGTKANATDIEDCFAQGAVVSIGNYDGVHRGHQALLKQLKEQSLRLKIPACVMTFEPMPSEFFAREEGPGRLSTWRERFQLIKQEGIDVLYLLPFDQSIANLSPVEFVEQFLVNRLNTRLLYVGDDFRFGRKRAGTIDTLKELAAIHQFEVHQLSTVQSGSERVSSSLIRSHLLEGDLDEVAFLLGRRYSMSGRVIRGQRLGRTLGYPTANVRPRRNSLPMSGIFAVTVKITGQQKSFDGVANLGFRPTVGGGDALLEAHLFDFDADLYGQHITVEFVKKLRDEEHFSSLDLMVEQMHHDSAEAREILLQIGLR